MCAVSSENNSCVVSHRFVDFGDSAVAMMMMKVDVITTPR